MFRALCTQKGFTNVSNGVTHVLMDGGSLHVPFDRLGEFYGMCADRSNRVYVVEQKTELYNFFMDIDFCDSEALSLEQIRSVCKIIYNKISEYHKSECYVFAAKPKKKGDLVKTGIHMNWPGFVVDQAVSINLRYVVVNTLLKLYPDSDWENAIDISVYTGSGFRLPWSFKKSKHSHCNGTGCTVCNNSGKVDEGPYIPFFRVTNGEFEDIVDKEPSVELLMKATVRSQATKRTPVKIEEEVVCKPVRKREGSFTAKETRNVLSVDSETLKALEGFVRQHMPGQERSYIQGLYKNERSVYAKTNSRFCENLGRNHNSNHVWFLISENGEICQKCFCRCETMKDRKSDFCKDFTGRKHNLYPSLVKKLFPDNKKLDTIKNNVYNHRPIGRSYPGNNLF